MSTFSGSNERHFALSSVKMEKELQTEDHTSKKLGSWHSETPQSNFLNLASGIPQLSNLLVLCQSRPETSLVSQLRQVNEMLRSKVSLNVSLMSFN